MIWLVPLIFVIVHGPDGDSARIYDGQNQTTITSVLVSEGKTGDFVTQQQYNDFIVAHTPPVPTPTQINLQQRTDAINDLLSSAEGRDKFIRAVLLVILDEVNVIRAALVPSQVARTPAQMRTAIQNKINAGAAD